MLVRFVLRVLGIISKHWITDMDISVIYGSHWTAYDDDGHLLNYFVLFLPGHTI
jgi:hypothetical protein